MFYIIKFLESLVFPPGIFIVLLLAIGIISFQRHHAFASVILVVALLLYAASTSVVAYALIRPLETAYTQPKNPVGDVLVMLGGGATYGTPDVAGVGNLTGDGANRLLTTAMLYEKTELPIVLTSGPMCVFRSNSPEYAHITNKKYSTQFTHITTYCHMSARSP